MSLNRINTGYNLRKVSKEGFTIVELLIVVVVIAILAAITIVSYNGITERANTAKLASTVNSYVKIFQLYKGQFGDYPYIEDNVACLGDPANYPVASGFTAGECGASYDAGYVATVNTELKKVTNTLPDASYAPVLVRNSPSSSITYRGVFFSDDVNALFYALKGNTCPIGNVIYFALSNTSICEVSL